MSFKNILLKYITFYPIYKKALKANAYDAEGIAAACKESILNDATIDKEQTFYYLKFTQEKRTWHSGLCFSYGEAMARKTYSTHKRYNTKFYLLELEAQKEAEIQEVSLQNILDDEAFFSDFVARIAYLVPFDKNEIVQMPDDYSVKTLWNFSHHLHAEFLFYDGKVFLHSTHKDAKLPSSMDYGYSTVIDDEGKYGIIHNKTVLLSGEPDFEWVLPCEYYYINIEGLLAEVQKEKPSHSDEYRECMCNIVDLETKEVYMSHALCNSLEYDNCITVGEEGLLQYIKIDPEQKNIVAKSPKYSYIATPIHYALKPVQDPKTNLWGYIDKECKQVISPRYKDYGFFNDGYAVLKEEGKAFVIDETGNVVIEPKYKTIEHYDYDYFFVEDERGCWAVFLKDKIYVDFIDISAIDEVPEFNNFPYVMTRDEKYYIVLRHAMREKQTALQENKHKLPLKEYINLFEPIRSEKNLREAGLLGHKVHVKKIPQAYEDIIKKEESYTIGWNYPSSASMFNMTVELPVMFTKVDGDDLTLGICFEDLELRT